MRNIRVDTEGELRCWHCGSTAFKEKRTLKSKVAFGVGALLAKKKLKCQVCSQYNQTGRAQPYKGPASKRLGRKYETLVNMFGQDVADTEPDIDLPDEEAVVPAVGPPAAPAAWYPDPHGGDGLRYFDGTIWTERTANKT